MAMKDQTLAQARNHQFEEVTPTEESPGLHLLMEDLKGVRLTVSAELGKCVMPVREVLELKRGSVITLNKIAGEMTDIYVNGLPLARGEVVVIGDTLHVRIGEITGAVEPEGEKAPESEGTAEGGQAS
jgi:flagellar motor switch protein FliN